ncbi:MAG: YbaK/EbsC family protein [Acidimicrobiia bacterium]|nr:YbaK/EbsC family protein [Acidimicrobiia bacterium]MDX2467201.1 YbaK/EbsC family protein [Acidimicrobiia bacterium]
MSAEKLREYLLTNGVPYEVHEHPLAYTTSRVAEVEHVTGKEIAKPVILMADDHFVMAVVPGHKHVDLAKAREAFGCEELRLAEESEFVTAFTDCERGAEPPLGHLYGMKTIVDLSLDSPRVTFRGGSHTQTITMGLEDYRVAARAVVGDVAAGH